MLSLRLARSIPKSVLRPALSFRSTLPVTRLGICQSIHQEPIARPSYKAFSTSPWRFESAGPSDLELSAKIEKELEIEKEERDVDGDENFKSLSQFLAKSNFSLEDIPGNQKVTMTKQFGNEHVKIEFSISAMNDGYEEEEDPLTDSDDIAMEDEDFNINQKGAPGKMAAAPEDPIVPADRGEEVDPVDRTQPAFPTPINITITKPGKGALQFTAIAQDGVFQIGEVSQFQKAELAEYNYPDPKREAVYAGPPFSNLDSDLQTMLERYIDERGINAELAMFVPDYVDYKEQKEYVRWLENMKDFIDA